MESIERNLTMKLYRTYCPESTRLGEYELGILDQAATAAIKTHLNDCLRCRTELEGLRIYLKDLQPEISFSLVERVRVLIAELLPRPGGVLATSPAFAMRGADRPPLEYQAGDTSLTLEISPDPADDDRRVLMGLMMTPAAANWSASLWSEGNPLEGALVDELGNFVLSGLAPGQYDLILSGEDVEIHVQSLDVA
jgi:hypothetical protein